MFRFFFDEKQKIGAQKKKEVADQAEKPVFFKKNSTFEGSVVDDESSCACG
jgi:hypothetical protein